MAPQSAVGGCVPRPMKLNPAMNTIFCPTSNVNSTMIGPRILGSTCLVTIRASDAPSARAASMNGYSFRLNTTPRTTRA